MITPTRLFDFLYKQLEEHPKEDFVCYKMNGKWKKYSTQEVVDIVNHLSQGFLKLGIEKDNKVGIVSANRPEWNFIDLALQQIGAVSVPMYPTITPKDYRYIFEDSQLKYVFAGDQELVDKVKTASEGLDFYKGTYSFEELDSVDHWTKVIS